MADKRTIMPIVQQLDAKRDALRKILEETTGDFLQKTALSELKKKVREVSDIVAEFYRIFNATKPMDYPDGESVEWAAKPAQIETIRDEIKLPLSARINELENLELEDKLKKAEEVFQRLKQEKIKLTTTYLRNSDQNELEKKKQELRTLHGEYTGNNAFSGNPEADIAVAP